MTDKCKTRKKGSIGEQEVSNVLQRYSVDTVLSLLREVSQVAVKKIDWHELVKSTGTGIRSAREYQLLWRHLAYGEALIDQHDHDQDPKDDDSDLEFELEAFPAISREASLEAAACVKVLLASGPPIDANLPNNSTIEAPLTINIPNCKAFGASSGCSLLPNSLQGTNISIPVSVQKQPVPSTTFTEKKPNNGASGINVHSRKRRRGWSTEEDMKLTDAVRKHGEKNWAHIARGEFLNDRKASELSQRWASLKKKQCDTKVGTSSQSCETQLAAAHRAMSLALDMPMGDGLKAAGPMSSVGIKSNHQPQTFPALQASQQLGRPVPPKSQMLNMKTPANPAAASDSIVKAAAVAAGARVATSSGAYPLIDGARSQNVVRIPTAVGAMKSPSAAAVTSQLPSNVHFIRNGLANAPIAAYSPVKPNVSQPSDVQQAQAPPKKPALPGVQPSRVGAAPILDPKSGMGHASPSVPSVKVPESVGKSSCSPSFSEKKEPVERDEAQLAIVGDAAIEVGKLQTSSPGNALKENTQCDPASIPMLNLAAETKDDQAAFPGPEIEGKSNADSIDDQNPRPNGETELKSSDKPQSVSVS